MGETIERQQVPLANVLTIGARNFPNLRDFYRRLGWPQVVDDEDFAAFELQGTVLAIFPVEKLAADGNAEPEPGRGGIGFTVGVVVEHPHEVDRLVDRMREAGGRVTKEPVKAEFFEGRSAYVADPEGTYWEIAWAGSENSIVAAARRAAGLHDGP